MKTSKTVRVYRFHDQVALSFKTDDRYANTVYLDPDVAFDLGTVLQTAQFDIIKRTFSKSKFHTRLVKQIAERSRRVKLTDCWNSIKEMEGGGP